jgi:VWFA-related protein
MRLLSSFLIALTLTASAVPLPAQDDVTFRSDTRLVVLHASVADKGGKLLTNLPQNSFKVFENGVEQQVKLFKREDVPVSLGIIIDNSASMRDKRVKVAAASLGLVKASNPQDEVFIVNFNDDAYLDQSFTNDIKQLEDALQKYDTRGGTAMRDAISLSIDYVKTDAKKDKKVLLVVTDGNDNSSAESLERLVKRAQDMGILVYAIGILAEEEPRESKKAKRALKAITEATGGMVYYPKDVSEVDKLALQVAHDIRNQYIIAYSPSVQELDGSYRQIKVTVNGHNNAQVRTRSGYYATPATPKNAPKEAMRTSPKSSQ